MAGSGKHALADLLAQVERRVDRVYCATYTYRADALHDYVIDKLHLARAAKCWVVMDGSCQTKEALTAGRSGRIRLRPRVLSGRRARHGRFHPKCLLLESAPDEAGHRLFSAYVGSANITYDGIGADNDETALFASEIDLRRGGWQAVLVTAVADVLRRAMSGADVDIPRLSASVRPKSASEPGTFGCFHSYEHCLLEQLRSFVANNRLGKPSRLWAAAPFLAEDAKLYSELAKALGATRSCHKRLVTNAPYRSEPGQRVCLEPTGWQLCPYENKGRVLHAKLVIADYGRRRLVVQGSANLTASAWLRSVRSGGNVELVTAWVGPQASTERLVAPIVNCRPGKVETALDQSTKNDQGAFAVAWYDLDNRLLSIALHCIDVKPPCLRARLRVGRRSVSVLAQKTLSDAPEYTCSSNNINLLLPDSPDEELAPLLRIFEPAGFKGEFRVQLVKLEPDDQQTLTDDPWDFTCDYQNRSSTEDRDDGAGDAHGIIPGAQQGDVWPLIDELSRRLIQLERWVRNRQFSSVTDDAPIIERLRNIEKDGLKFLIGHVSNQWTEPPCDESLREILQRELERRVQSLRRELLRRVAQ